MRTPIAASSSPKSHIKLLSVVVCTWNRVDILRQCLEALEAQTLDRSSFEVVVIDNNSCDETADALSRFAETTTLAFKSIMEPRQGLSIARNRGIVESQGDAIVFLDDDAIADPLLLRNIVDGFMDTRADIIAGKIVCVTPDNLDSDLPAPYLSTLSFSSLDLGAETRPMLTHEYAVGANMSIRRSLITQIGLFDECLGYAGERKLVGEDTEMCDRAKEHGALCVWVPQAVVYHHPSPTRFTKTALRKGAFYYGVGRFRHKIGADPSVGVRFVQIARLSVQLAIGAMLVAIVAWSPSLRLKTELKMRITLGKVAAAWRG